MILSSVGSVKKRGQSQPDWSWKLLLTESRTAMHKVDVTKEQGHTKVQADSAFNANDIRVWIYTNLGLKHETPPSETEFNAGLLLDGSGHRGRNTTGQKMSRNNGLSGS
ncbi:hypothetical protein NQZ79_g6014 [Umbelopsis isabellina]|nr:hypothetical protein NQZ79_g6014 [Umbelopsis isabellina]